jgi:general secretion pathway protein F/type IV pilus assembly protein PilC
MATFQYEARTAAGQVVTGVVEADNESAAVRTLDEKSLFPVRVRAGAAAAAPTAFGGGRISLRDVGVLYGQLGDLLHAGVPMLRALDTLTQALPQPRLRAEVQRVRGEVADGRSLADALGARPKVFATAHAAMVRAGERGGFLEDVLTSLSDFVERQDELQSKVRGAMVYPTLLVSLLTAVVLVALVWLVPQFQEFLRDAEKPLPTQVLFGLSHLVRQDWPILVGILALGGFGLWGTLRSPAGRRIWDQVRIRLPLFGKAIRMVSITRFCRVLGTMLSSGVPILEALSISKDATGSAVLAATIGRAVENVRAGEPLAEPLRASGVLPPEVVEMISVAEESNQLETVLVRIADTIERRTNRQVDLAVRLIEPLILVVMAGAIGFVAAALYYPIFTMARSLK